MALKVIILGNSGVGKTSLIHQYVNNNFNDKLRATVGAGLVMKDVMVDGKVVTLHLWDTAGQESFKSLPHAFYREADCCVLVCDITSIRSFEALDTWRDAFLIEAEPRNRANFPFIVLGNKLDLGEGQRQVTEEQIATWCEARGDILYFETSAKDAIHLEKVFETVAKKALQQNGEHEPVEAPSVINPADPIQTDSERWQRFRCNC